jgi:AraC family transcriptional regulator of adaptative response / DNA-3-methyladenine glycosylase II
MTLPLDHSPMLDTSLTDAVCQRACNSRDARFDGLFFVGITTTQIYCRPVCPARVSFPDRRRFFGSPAAAERAGFRPCMRCRPELAPGHALIDAISRLASSAAHRIEAGALNGRSVADLAHELGVSERHLRRALERELGVSPIDLAQTHRLLLAKRLLADTTLPVTRVAYVSGFQSLRRFNSLFRERYRLPPSALRRRVAPDRADDPESRPLSLTLSYRAPLAWSAMLGRLQRDLTPGMEHVDGQRYGRTVELAGTRGIVYVEDGQAVTAQRTGRQRPGARGEAHLRVEVSPSLVPVLMPLLARLRRVYDLDAEPRVVDRHLADAGLAQQVVAHPGLRIPGAMDGFEVALAVLLRGRPWSGVGGRVAQQVVQRLGEAVALGHPALTRISPTAARVAEAGAGELERAGVAARQSRAIVQVARALCERRLLLEAGSDPIAAHHTLQAIDGVGERLAKIIVMRALSWPDAFPASDRLLQRRAGLDSTTALLDLAEKWRPWRAYAALHLWLG